MTQTVRHITSSRTCDIYKHPDQSHPSKGYKNDRCRFKYSVKIESLEILIENILGSSFDLMTKEEMVNNNLEFYVLQLAKGFKYIIEDESCSERYFARNLKEAQDKFSNFFC